MVGFPPGRLTQSDVSTPSWLAPWIVRAAGADEYSHRGNSVFPAAPGLRNVPLLIVGQLTGVTTVEELPEAFRRLPGVLRRIFHPRSLTAHHMRAIVGPASKATQTRGSRCGREGS